MFIYELSGCGFDSRCNNNNDWHYLTVKNISELLRGITSNHNGEFYCLKCFHSYTTKKRLKNHKKTCENHDFCYPKIPDEGKKVLKYNSEEKSLKVLHTIYADLECLLEKIDTCQNKKEKYYTEKKA